MLGVIITSLTPKCNQPAKIWANYYFWLNNTHCLSVFLCRLRITTQLRSDSWYCWQNGRYFYKAHLATLWIPEQGTWLLCSVSVIMANKLSLQELCQITIGIMLLTSGFIEIFGSEPHFPRGEMPVSTPADALDHWCYCFKRRYETSSANWNTLERNAGRNVILMLLRMVGSSLPPDVGGPRRFH